MAQRVQTEDPLFVRDIESKALLVRDVAAISRARSARERAQLMHANHDQLVSTVEVVKELMHDIQRQVQELKADVRKLQERNGTCR